MTHSWPSLPVRVGDVIWFDGTEVEISGREESDVLAVIVDGDATFWHVDDFTEATRDATSIEVDSGEQR